MDINKTTKNTRITALAVAGFLTLVMVVCLLYLFTLDKSSRSYTAEIYQDGRLIYTISLSQVPQAYTLEIAGENGGLNHIEVRPGSIGVTWADCPDKLCVRQGFIHNPSIPVTCLPNKLVIRLRSDWESSLNDEPDAVTY